MMVIPVGNDQPCVAQQVENLHLGIRLDRRGLTPDMLRDGARRVLRDASYQERMAAFREKSRAAGGNAAIAKAILTELRCMGVPRQMVWRGGEHSQGARSRIEEG